MSKNTMVWLLAYCFPMLHTKIRWLEDSLLAVGASDLQASLNEIQCPRDIKPGSQAGYNGRGWTMVKKKLCLKGDLKQWNIVATIRQVLPEPCWRKDFNWTNLERIGWKDPFFAEFQLIQLVTGFSGPINKYQYQQWTVSHKFITQQSPYQHALSTQKLCSGIERCDLLCCMIRRAESRINLKKVGLKNFGHWGPHHYRWSCRDFDSGSSSRPLPRRLGNKLRMEGRWTGYPVYIPFIW